MTPTLRGPARLLARLVPLAALLLAPAGGCAFDRNWKRLAAAEPAAASDDKLAGRWEGTWQSERSNHRGKLRAIVSPPPGSDDGNEPGGAYRADFNATYFGVLRFGYSMTLATQQDGDVIRFQGEENLGRLAGGVYRYDGTTDGQSFDCTYQSKNDHGRFQMTRPAR